MNGNMVSQLILSIVLGGVPILVGVILIVESFKRLGFATDEGWFTPQRAALLTGIVLGGVALAADPGLSGDISTIVQTSATYLFGGITAGLGYDLAGKAFFLRLQAVLDSLFGVKIRAEDL